MVFFPSETPLKLDPQNPLIFQKTKYFRRIELDTAFSIIANNLKYLKAYLNITVIYYIGVK